MVDEVAGVVSYSRMSRDHTRDRAGDQLDLGRLHAHVCRIITCLSEPIHQQNVENQIWIYNGI